MTGRRLPARLAAIARRLRDERGFTLVELLVATVAGIVATAALGMIVISTVHFSSNVADRIDANQEGRTAMEKIVQALNSSCIYAGAAPIVSSGSTLSDATHVYFYSALADNPSITPNLDEVSISGNSLVLSTFASTGGNGPAYVNGAQPADITAWTFSTTASTNFTLLPYVTAPNNGSGPVFQYYGYTAGSGSLNNNLDSTNGTLTSPQKVAEVVISFTALPSDNWNATGRAADLTDSVVLRLTPASSTGNPPNYACD
jgi:Tfp pilus assembly protein PilW